MSVKININDSETQEEAAVKVGFSTPEEDQSGVKIEIKQKEGIEFDLKLRSALNGDLIILDHKDIDIVVQSKSNKVVTFAKDIMSDVVYGAESRLLEFLRKSGVINYDSIQGGNIYGSLEGSIMESDTHDPLKTTLLSISEWMKTEQPYISGVSAYDQMEDDAMLDPDNEHSTELGEVPQADEKGSIYQQGVFAPYIYGRYSY
tara:strand:- start:37 stop:645 length:609 start_codon:yes stop_codon:yes gene_type:complete